MLKAMEHRLHLHTRTGEQSGEAIGLLLETSQALMSDLSAFASDQMERNLLMAKRLVAVSTPQEAAEIHAAYLKQTVAELSAVSHRAGGLCLDALRQWGGWFSMC